MEKRSNALAVWSLILGIVGLLTGCIVIGIAFDIVAIVLGIIGIKKDCNKGLCVSGIVLGGIGAVLMFIILALGGIGAILNDDKDNSAPTAIDTTIESNPNNISNVSTEEKSRIATIEEQTLYEDNGVIIKATSLEDNKLNLYIENNSTLNLGFNMHSYGINGIMANNNIYDMDCSVPAGSKANATLRIHSDVFDDYGIKEIRQISTHIWAYDEDAYFKEFDTGVILIDTDLNDGSLQKVPCDILLEENGLVYSLVSLEDNKCIVSIENNTDSLYEVDMEDVIINDWAYDTDWDFDIASIQIHPNCQAIITLDIDSEFLRTNSIETIESISFDFSLEKDYDYMNTSKSSKITYTK